jgi:hypothetical protein
LQVGIGEASTAREAAASGTCEEMRDHQRPHAMAPHEHHQQHHHPHHQIATATAFHITRPSHPISTIISPPPLHHTSIILDQDSYHVSRIMLQNENFQVINQPNPFYSSFFFFFSQSNHESILQCVHLLVCLLICMIFSGHVPKKKKEKKLYVFSLLNPC